MLMSRFAEAVGEDAALAWLEGLGYAVVSGLQITPDEPQDERCGTVGQFGQAGRF
jgi:hypothetical protein